MYYVILVYFPNYIIKCPRRARPARPYAILLYIILVYLIIDDMPYGDMTPRPAHYKQYLANSSTYTSSKEKKSDIANTMHVYSRYTPDLIRRLGAYCDLAIGVVRI